MPRIVALLFALALPVSAAAEVPASWQREFPKTDFSNRVVPLEEIRSGGPPRDGIPSIDGPRFVAVEDAAGLAGREPVIGLVIDGEARAYPLRILTWHEIVNDEVAGVPVAVGEVAWTLELLRREGRIEHGDLVVTWRPGQASALDKARIAEGRDVGTVLVQRRTAQGLEDIPYDVTFAFRAFRPQGVLHTLGGTVTFSNR